MENIHQQYPDLFSPSLKVRYEATKAFALKGGKHEPDTWEGCWGSANGWTMLVGPSPGSRKDAIPDHTDQLALRKKLSKQIFIRPKACEIQFKDEWKDGKKPEKQTRREKNWTRLMAAAAGGDTDVAEALTTVANLDFLNCALEKNIQHQRLVSGSEQVLELIRLSRPRLLIPLTMNVYRVFRDYLQANWKTVRSVQKSMDLTVYPDERFPIIWFNVPGCTWDSLLVMAPKHPSWIPSNKALLEFSELIKRTLAVS